jgi:lysophospholipase L1-like esterase
LPERRGPRSPLAARLAIALVAVAASLLAAEALVRVFPLEAPGRIFFSPRAVTTRLDPDLIWSLVPGSSVVRHTSEFREVRRINSLGMRGPEPSPPQAGETRVLAMGDSFTFGHGVDADDAYPAVLEAVLRERGRKTVVFNGGVPGYNVDQSYRALPARAAQVRPDVVLVGVHCSDVVEGWLWPLYAVDGGALVPLDARRTGVYLQGPLIGATPDWLLDSALFEQVLRRLPARDPFAQRPGGSREDLARWSREKIVLKIASMARAAGAGRPPRVAAILMPCMEHFDPGPPPYADLETRLERSGVPTLDAMAALGGPSASVRDLFYPLDIHLNRAGNHALAAAAAQFLSARVLPVDDGRRRRSEVNPRT